MVSRNWLYHYEFHVLLYISMMFFIVDHHRQWKCTIIKICTCDIIVDMYNYILHHKRSMMIPLSIIEIQMIIIMIIYTILSMSKYVSVYYP